MKSLHKTSAVTCLALLAAAAGAYLVGIHDAKDAATPDVITFAPSRNVAVRRIVASPGDRIEVRNSVVFLNGVRLDEPAR